MSSQEKYGICDLCGKPYKDPLLYSHRCQEKTGIKGNGSKRPTKHPENYCPICGNYYRVGHKCPDSVIREIDREDREAEEKRTYNDRLEYGMFLLSLASNGYPDS